MRNLFEMSIPNIQVPKLSGVGSNNTEQVFHIDKLEFPNVKSGKEIEGAIRNLSTYASQWANKRK